MDKQKTAAEGVLSGSQREKSGTQLLLRGQHFILQLGVVKKIENHKMIIVSRGKKKVKRTTKKATDTIEIEGKEEQELEVFDSIMVEPYHE